MEDSTYNEHDRLLCLLLWIANMIAIIPDLVATYHLHLLLRQILPTREDNLLILLHTKLILNTKALK